MSAIKKIHGREVLDSRGNPTLEVEVFTKAKGFGRAIVPSGASTGIYEAWERRDGDEKRYFGKGVLKGANTISGCLSNALEGSNVLNQCDIDHMLIKWDGTENKKNLGANVILGISMACAKAAANELSIPLYQYLGGCHGVTLPVPMMNIMNGGAHSNNAIDFQEFMIVPAGARTMQEALQMGSEIFHTLKKLLGEQGYSTAVGDEGGFAPDLDSNEAALDFIVQAIEAAGYEAGGDVALAIDVAASEFYKDGEYYLSCEDKHYTSEALVELYQKLCKKYPIISIEDGLDQDDWNGWAYLTESLGDKIQLVGDDFFVTNTKRLKEGIDKGVANAILIKVNQIGTLTETFEAIEMAKRAGYGVVISHRSGESEDTTIADLAVAVNAGQIKTGSLSRTDRLAKYNQLLRIEEQLGGSGIYAGWGAFYNLDEEKIRSGKGL